MNENRILVTGASGYLGSTLSNFLKKSGYDLDILVRKSSSLSGIKYKIKNNLVFVEDLYSTHIEEKKYSTIVHCATKYKSSNMFDLVETNIGFPISIIDKLLYNGGLFINIDTSLDTNTNFYSKTKNYLKNILIDSCGLDSFKLVNFELQYFYNEFEPDGRFFKSLVKACVSNKDFELTLGDQVRDFIYMDDVCSALKLTLDHASKEKEDFINVEVGTGEGLSIKELAFLVKKMTFSYSNFGFGKVPYRENETMHSVANTSYLSCLGWKREFPIELGLSRIINHLKKM